jgi:hypothetical protein
MQPVHNPPVWSQTPTQEHRINHELRPLVHQCQQTPHLLVPHHHFPSLNHPQYYLDLSAEYLRNRLPVFHPPIEYHKTNSRLQPKLQH